MPKEKITSSVASNNKKQQQLQQLEQQITDTSTPITKKTKQNDKRESKKAKTPSSVSSSNSAIKKSHNKSLSAPNFIKLEPLNKKDLKKLNESFTSDLPTIESSPSLAIIDYSMNINSLNNTKNNELSSPSLRSGSRSNDRFHQLFPSVPLTESVVDTYSCAYVKSLNLQHGVMFLTKNFICFYSKILTSENILILKLKHINSITKTMHALIFPTAIRIETKNSTYSFTSFRSRSHTLDHLTSLLNQSRQKEIDQSYKIQTNEPLDGDEIKEPILFNKKNSSETLVLDNCADLSKTNDKFNESMNSNESNQKDDNNSGDFYLSRNDNLNSEISTKENRPNENVNEKFVYKTNQLTCNSTSNHNNYYNNSNKFIYHFDYSDLSRNKVTVSLRHKKTLIEKVKILLGLLIPGFFEISRIDSLLPICFLMCVLLLLNAFVLLNKVNHVDLMFSDLLLQEDF